MTYLTYIHLGLTVLTLVPTLQGDQVNEELLIELFDARLIMVLHQMH